MTIKTIEIEGHENTIRIDRCYANGEYGARVTILTDEVCRLAASENRESRWAKACTVAALVYGRDKKGRPAATNSMIHEVWTELDRVAGC
ncbi:MAG: hypothetical protein KF869_15510 [Phycisphaeraceae bacterium]|nr:hypothetical protein [Phycisphaeraceae bacterium]